MADPRHPGRLKAALAGLSATALSMLQTRLSLASIELSEEKDRLLALLVLAFLGVSLVGAGVLAAGFFVVVALWDSHRLLALGAVTLLYLGGGAALLWHVRRTARAAPPLLSATLAEMARDGQALGRHTGTEEDEDPRDG